AFMLAAQERGHRVVHVRPADISLHHRQVFLRGHHVEVKAQQGDHHRVHETVGLAAEDCGVIFIRTDPPFDQAYLTVSWLLTFAEEAGVRVVNSPRGLRAANEHLYSLHFPELCPETLVTNSRDELLDFVERMGGMAIAKPIDGHGGFGVVRLQTGDSNLNALIDMLTVEGRQPIMAQRFLSDIAQGDKRLIVVDGELRGAVRRMPAAGDHRGNVHVGGTAVAAEPDADDRAIVAAMSARLKEDGLFFVGLDVIGGKLIEVNVTSPTLLQELRRLGGPDLAAEIVERVTA
ncbi:MAG TPA: glutathione synthase, partial [Trueperaceae bacterium]|nr:glutathione synthase [Trueperaceae bacterium]